MTHSSEISFYVDTMLVETILAESHFSKKAGMMSDLLSKVKDYFESKIDHDHPVASVINLLAPAGISFIFSSMGFGKFGLLLGLLTSVLHVNVSGMITSLYDKVKNMISGGDKVSSSQIDQATNSTIAEHNTPPTQQDAQEIQQHNQPAADDGKVYSSLELLYDAKIISLALIEYEKINMRLTKVADMSSVLKNLVTTKAKGTTILGTLLGWIFKIALTAAGLMVAGDLINHFIGNHQSTTTPSGPTSSQTKYHLIGDTPLPKEMPITNTPDNISNMLVQFAKDVYSNLDGKENLIKGTPGFQAIKNKISWTNMYNPGSGSIMIPPIFSSKKQLVDYFIDDVAKADQE